MEKRGFPLTFSGAFPHCTKGPRFQFALGPTNHVASRGAPIQVQMNVYLCKIDAIPETWQVNIGKDSVG